MDITIIGLQNAGKTSLLRVLAVGDVTSRLEIVDDGDYWLTRFKGDEFTIEYESFSGSTARERVLLTASKLDTNGGFQQERCEEGPCFYKLVVNFQHDLRMLTNHAQAGTLVASLGSVRCGNDIALGSMPG